MVFYCLESAYHRKNLLQLHCYIFYYFLYLGDVLGLKGWDRRGTTGALDCPHPHPPNLFNLKF